MLKNYKRLALLTFWRISLLNFICSQCKALYCDNCARAISQLENTCWVCDDPIDETKPVKLPERKEEVTAIDGDTTKKRN